MKRRGIWTSFLACVSAAALHAQEVSELELLRKELQELRESFRRVQEQQRRQIEALEQRIDALTVAPAAPAQPSPAPSEPPSPSPKAATAAPAPSRTLAAPVTLWGGQGSYLNLSLSALTTVGTSTTSDIESLQLGGHDPKQRGFTLQNLETVFDGKVDPYFRGQANVIFQIDPEGETIVEAEEAYLETLSLPANLQVKAGLFMTEFGRLNPTHPHAWDFVDQPLVNARFLGGDGLRGPGARLSWLAPTPFYSELFLAVANSQGETAFSFRNNHEGEPFLGRPALEREVETVGDLLFVPRYAVSLDFSESQTILAGASAALGPNSSGPHADTQIYGLDLFWKWKSPRHHGGFPFVSWQTEAMMRRFEAGAFPGDAQTPPLPAETLYDYGFYSQVAYGFRKGWVAGWRGDYVVPESQAGYEQVLGPDPARASRWRISPSLTWYPSEFSKLRLQYNYDRRQDLGEDHSVWFQFEFLLGSHAAHQF